MGRVKDKEKRLENNSNNSKAVSFAVENNSLKITSPKRMNGAHNTSGNSAVESNMCVGFCSGRIKRLALANSDTHTASLQQSNEERTEGEKENPIKEVTYGIEKVDNSVNGEHVIHLDDNDGQLATSSHASDQSSETMGTKQEQQHSESSGKVNKKRAVL
ncbi:hypothetical protein VNO77_06044 [Canavalia gladiata]|uniref:Uncharacterized protein n=1 Tax=Canavalia gladiata TaxID=3824 RepID=A0AAN9MZE3_CANGL